jgi:hypothetical protein
MKVQPLLVTMVPSIFSGPTNKKQLAIRIFLSKVVQTLPAMEFAHSSN